MSVKKPAEVNRSAVWFKLISLLLVYMLLLMGYVPSKGFYSLSGLVALVLALFALLFLRTGISFTATQNNFVYALSSCALLSSIFSLVYYGGIYQRPGHEAYVSKILLFIVIFLFASYFMKPAKISDFFEALLKSRFLSLVSIAVLLRVLLLISSPNPWIDVFHFLNYGAKALVMGKNPYSIIYPHIYINVFPNYYGYLPGTLILTLPAALIFNDVRYTFVLAEILSALFLFKLGIRSVGGRKDTVVDDVAANRSIIELLPLIYLFNPISLFILEQAWIEPLMVLFLVLFAYYFYATEVGRGVTSALFGILLTIKQYLICAPLFLFKFKRFGMKYFLVSLGVALVIVLPFLVWNPGDFIHDVFIFHYANPPRYDALTLNSLVHSYFGFDIPAILVLPVVVLVVLVLFFTQSDDLSGFVSSIVILLLAVFLLSKQAFANYYYFLSSCLILEAALLYNEFFRGGSLKHCR